MQECRSLGGERALGAASWRWVGYQPRQSPVIAEDRGSPRQGGDARARHAEAAAFGAGSSVAALHTDSTAVHASAVQEGGLMSVGAGSQASLPTEYRSHPIVNTWRGDLLRRFWLHYAANECLAQAE